MESNTIRENGWIPEGFVLLVGPNNENYILPEFMVPALDQDFHSNKKKKKLRAYESSGTVSLYS
jgi:hypothetical protein